jgi:hypothetical protein
MLPPIMGRIMRTIRMMAGPRTTMMMAGRCRSPAAAASWWGSWRRALRRASAVCGVDHPRKPERFAYAGAKSVCLRQHGRKSVNFIYTGAGRQISQGFFAGAASSHFQVGPVEFLCQGFAF